MTCRSRQLVLILALCRCSLTSGAAGLQPECKAYLDRKGFASPEALKSTITQCSVNKAMQDPYAPDPVSDIPGVTDTTPLSCRYGHPSLFNAAGGTCCGWKPHFNWVVATCDPNSHQQDSAFCSGLPDCVAKNGKDSCGAKVNYVAAYQYDGEEFVLLDESTAGTVTPDGVEGSFAQGTGWEQVKNNFTWRSGDWTSKFAPWGEGPTGPRGLTPPAMLWVLSADSFYYGAFYMLSQLTLNLEGQGYPTGTNCWNWELDPVEGALGWLPKGAKLPGNMNQAYATNNAAVSGCMPVTYFASQANGLRRNFSQPEQFVKFCQGHPGAAGCKPWEEDVMWSGGIHGTQRFENYANQPYVFAVVVDHRGYWIYRWIPDETTGHTGWPGIERTKAARRLRKRPDAVTDPAGLETDVRGDVHEAVILQPSVPPEAACLRASIEAPNFQFGADALGAMAAQLGEYSPGGALEGAQNWWAHFADTEQYQDYPLSIAGVPKSQLLEEEAAMDCNQLGKFGCDCKLPPKARRLEASAEQKPQAIPVAAKEIVKGISYGPMPCKAPCVTEQDDFMSEAAKHLWGPRGRADLQIMRQLGANSVRLYGNNPELDHSGFLDEAHKLDLKVSIGISDFPYTQHEGACAFTGMDCFNQIKESYLLNLKTGFLTESKTYHPAIREVIVVNEPDLKLGLVPAQFTKGVISAIDGILEAEKEAGVVGTPINLTVAYSFGICLPCTLGDSRPALGQMLHLQEAIHDPLKYGYQPRNDLVTFFYTRFSNSFNTANPADSVKAEFLDHYEQHFPNTPVTIQEYNPPHFDLSDDLPKIIKMAENSTLLTGISFFEFQIRYDKGGSEMDFGMFGLGDAVLASMPYFGKNFSIYCLTPQDSETSGTSIPDAVAVVYGGAAIDVSDLCVVNPLSVTLDQAGYLEVLSQKRTSQMSLFVERVINHMGATVYAHGYKHMNDLAQSLVDGSVNSGNGYSMADLASYLGSKPEWVDFDSRAKCVANRDVAPNVIGSAIGWTCSQNKSFSCDEIPAPCQNNTYRTADFVFSQYFGELGSDNPLVDCSFSGAAIYASSKLYNRWSGSARCVSDTDPVTSAPTTHIRSTTASFLQPSTSKGSGEVTSATLRSAVGQQMPVLLMLTLPVIVS
mmetsp:Transcript_122890/g.319569  ORF Transcript_122890/g.319569 Transcript_122890/m.319569 type:complete len:1137 (-) Transcript_122890:122-3532(-)